VDTVERPRCPPGRLESCVDQLVAARSCWTAIMMLQQQMPEQQGTRLAAGRKPNAKPGWLMQDSSRRLSASATTATNSSSYEEGKVRRGVEDVCEAGDTAHLAARHLASALLAGCRKRTHTHTHTHTHAHTRTHTHTHAHTHTHTQDASNSVRVPDYPRAWFYPKVCMCLHANLRVLLRVLLSFAQLRVTRSRFLSFPPSPGDSTAAAVGGAGHRLSRAAPAGPDGHARVGALHADLDPVHCVRGSIPVPVLSLPRSRCGGLCSANALQLQRCGDCPLLRRRLMCDAGPQGRICNRRHARLRRKVATGLLGRPRSLSRLPAVTRAC
jgi:hypothetical protein